jgi:hypothetical protein
MADNLKDRISNLMNQYWNLKAQFGSSFASEGAEDSLIEDAEEDRLKDKKRKKQNLYQVERGDDARDIVSKDVRSNEAPNVGSRYKLKPQMGIGLSDMLRNVANTLEISHPKIAKTLSNISILDHIKKIFANAKLSLIDFDDPFIDIKQDAVVYYWQNVDNGIKVWLNKQDLAINNVLDDVCKELQDLGYSVTKQGNGVIVTSGKVNIQEHDPEEVAYHLKGKVWTGKHKDKKIQKGWHTIAIEGCKLSYTLFPAGTVTIHCSGLFGAVETAHKINLENKRHLLNILRYQHSRYLGMFDPSTYGLQQESKPFKLKKHVLIPCTNNCILVVTPDDKVVLLHSKGQYELTNPDGKMGLNINKTFKKVNSLNEALYKDGDTYSQFLKVLKKRGYLQGD